MLRLMLLSLTGHGNPDESVDDGDNRELDTDHEYTHEDFQTMSLRDVEAISGVVRPVNRTPEEHQAYREKAWNSYRQDVSNRDEWGNARQGDLEPEEPAEPKEPI